MTSWIHSARFDLSFIMGGAFFSLALALLGKWEMSLIPLIFWAWVMLLEGPHFAVTWIRARRLGQEDSLIDSRIKWSFIFYLIPLLCLGLDALSQSNTFIGLWGFSIFSWSLYHNTRQHYGFVALWARKAKATEEEMKYFRWATYGVCYLLMSELFFHFKLKESFPSVYQAFPFLGDSFSYSPWVATLLSLTFLVWGQRRFRLPALYLMVLALYYSVLFFMVARWEPLYGGAISAAEGFLVVTVLNSSFHNIQYIALTLLKAHEAKTPKLFKKSLLSLGFGLAIFGPLFWMRGEVSFWGEKVNLTLMMAGATIFYLGIVGQHFFLDQYLWRSRKTA